MQNLLQQFKDACRIYGIQPARSKGQNFLINENVYGKIVDSAELNSHDTVLEVGPGLGFLTAKLAKKAKKVIAVELDDKLAAYLQSAIDMQGIENVEIINKNVLDIDPIALSGTSPWQGEVNLLPLSKGERSREAEWGYKIVANLPYNITSVFIRKFVSEVKHRPEMLVLMLQKEVAERIVAKAGDMSILAISVQFYADAEIVEYVPKQDFWPAPEVDSAVIKIRLKKNKTKIDEKGFFRLVKIGFSAKRKMLKNNLASGLKIDQKIAEKKIIDAGFNAKVRAEALSIENWIKLFEEFRENMV